MKNHVKIPIKEWKQYVYGKKSSNGITIINALIRSIVLDEWDARDGKPCESGDKCYVPKNEKDKALWEAMRSIAKKEQTWAKNSCFGKKT